MNTHAPKACKIKIFSNRHFLIVENDRRNRIQNVKVAPYGFLKKWKMQISTSKSVYGYFVKG